MKKIIKLLAAIALCFAAASMLVPQANAAIIKVGISPDYPPFDTLERGKLTGFDVELFEAIAKLSGDKLEWVTMSFDGLIAALKAGKIDAIASAMSASEKRKRTCDFSDVYYQARTVYIKQKSSPIAHKEGLRGLKVGTQLGTVQEAAMREFGARVVSNENPTVLILELNNSKLAAVALDALVGREFLANNPDLEEFFSESDGTEGFSIAFSKGKNPTMIARINEALAKFKQSDEYQKLLEKYKIQ